jgi:hypothetical protein
MDRFVRHSRDGRLKKPDGDRLGGITSIFKLMEAQSADNAFESSRNLTNCTSRRRSASRRCVTGADRDSQRIYRLLEQPEGPHVARSEALPAAQAGGRAEVFAERGWRVDTGRNKRSQAFGRSRRPATVPQLPDYSEFVSIIAILTSSAGCGAYIPSAVNAASSSFPVRILCRRRAMRGSNVF